MRGAAIAVFLIILFLGSAIAFLELAKAKYPTHFDERGIVIPHPPPLDGY